MYLTVEGVFVPKRLSLNAVVSRNVSRIIKDQGEPSIHHLTGEMVKFMVRHQGKGFDDYGSVVSHDAARKHVSRCLGQPNQFVWRIDYLEGMARVLGVKIETLFKRS